MKALIGNDGFDRRPHNIGPNCWYYEGTDGLSFYYEVPGVSVKKAGIIRWSSLRASLKRHDARLNIRKKQIRR